MTFDFSLLFRKRKAWALALMFAWMPSFLFSQTLGPTLGKQKKAEKPFLDPSLRMEGQLSFDEETKKALERGKRPGFLVAAQEEAGKIYSIEIMGAYKTEPDAVVLRLFSKVNRDFSSVLLSEDIVEIMKMGLFSDVVVWRKSLPSGAISLIYKLTEVPTIFQIKISGNDALTEDEIKESIAGLDNYQVAKLARLQEYAEKIRDLYVSKGYYLATVDVKTEATKEEDVKKREAEGLSDKTTMIEIDVAQPKADAQFVDVVFSVKENKQVKINRIYFSGNRHLDDELFKENLRSHENHLLSVLTDWGTFRQDYLEFDGLIIEKILHDNGFLQAKVLPPLVELSPDKSFIDIGFPIIENNQYRLGAVSISGDLVLNSEAAYRMHEEDKPDQPIFLASKLLSEVKQEEGDIFNKSLMAEAVLAITEKYRDQGFAYANLLPQPNIREKERIVDIAILVQSGPRVTIERIDIEGNEKTRDDVIRRELLVFEGDLYSSNLLKLGEQNVRRLAYFETVEMTNKPGSAPDKMILTIKVKEQNTGNIQAGAGYGTGGEGLVLRGQISNQNFLGRGQILSATANWSNYRRMFDVSFVEPYLVYLFDNPLTFAFTAYNRNIDMLEFNRLSTGGDVTLGYPLGGPFAKYSRKWKLDASPALMNYIFDFEALSLLLTYTLERVEISDLSMGVRKWNLFQGVPRYTSSLRPAIRLDQRDNRMFPSRGLFFEFRTEFASEYLGGGGLARFENYLRKNRKKSGMSDGRAFMTPESEANNFIRYTTNFRIYHNLDDWFFLKGLVFKTYVELGFLNTLGQPLLFENYALGGDNALRGYSYRSISPTERAGALFPFDPRQDVRVGGNKQFHGSFELQFPIFKALKISGVLFFDFGNVFSHEDNLFYIGKKSQNASRIHPTDPLKLYELLGLYSSIGGGVHWGSPLGYLRFEWGVPVSVRPSTTPGLLEKDPPVLFQFNMGPSF